MKAVLMTSAHVHPIPGEPRIPDFNDGYDDRAGAGAPNGERAKKIVEAKNYVYRLLSPGDMGVIKTLHLEPPPAPLFAWRVRAVLVWDQCPDYADDLLRELYVDLDMVIAGGGQMWSNLSAVDNYEIVEFSARTGGDYDIIVSAPHFRACSAEDGAQRVRTALVWDAELEVPVFAPGHLTNVAPQVSPMSNSTSSAHTQR